MCKQKNADFKKADAEFDTKTRTQIVREQYVSKYGQTEEGDSLDYSHGNFQTLYHMQEQMGKCMKGSDVIYKMGRPLKEKKPGEKKHLPNKSEKKAQKRQALPMYEELSNIQGIYSEEQLEQFYNLQDSDWGQQQWAEQKAKHSAHADKTNDEIYTEVMKGNYDNFEHLDEVMRRALATRYMRANFVPPPTGQPANEYVDALIRSTGNDSTVLFNPVFRLGLSLAAKSGFEGIPAKVFTEIDEACSVQIMKLTLMPQKQSLKDIDELSKEAYLTQTQSTSFEPKRWTDKQKELYAQKKAAVTEALKEDEAKKIFIAKTLLLTHMGRTCTLNEQGSATEYKGSATVLYTHCSRVAFTMPAVKKDAGCTKQAHDKMWQSYHELAVDYPHDEMTAHKKQLFSRASSTHDLKRRSVKSGAGIKEKKVLFNLIGQKGMNVGIGGTGLKGVAGKKIKNDGSCGHIYTTFLESTESKNGGMLIGFESDAHGMVNQLGHKHGLGNGEKASSFGAQRADEIGEKYGGRVVDLREFSAEKIAENMQILEAFMRSSFQLLRSCQRTDDSNYTNTLQFLNDITQKLSGNMMPYEELNEMMSAISAFNSNAAGVPAF